MVPMILASCGGAGGDEDANTIRPNTLDELTVTVDGASFTFHPYVNQIGGNEAGTFDFVRIGNGLIDGYEWPTSAGETTYTYTIVGPNSADITLLSGDPGGGSSPAPDLLQGPTATTISILFEVDTQGNLRPYSAILKDPAIGGGAGSLVIDGSISSPEGAVPANYRSKRQTQDEPDRQSAIAPQSINRDAYIFDFGIDGQLYLLHARTDLLGTVNPDQGTELGAALVSSVAFDPPNYEVNYSYRQPLGTDSGVLSLSPVVPGQPVVPVPVTLTLNFISPDQGTVVASDGRTGTFIAILR
jgi:hypothetical protein